MADNKASRNGTPKNSSTKEEVLESTVLDLSAVSTESAPSEQPVVESTDVVGEPESQVDAVAETPVVPPVQEPAPVVAQVVESAPVVDSEEPYALVVLKRHLSHYADGMDISRTANPEKGAIHQRDLVTVLDNWVNLHRTDPKLFFKYTGILLKWFNDHAEDVAHESYINRWVGLVHTASNALRHTDLIAVVKRLAKPETRALLASQPEQLNQSLKNVKLPESFIALLTEGLQNPGSLK